MADVRWKISPEARIALNRDKMRYPESGLLAKLDSLFQRASEFASGEAVIELSLKREGEHGSDYSWRISLGKYQEEGCLTAWNIDGTVIYVGGE